MTAQMHTIKTRIHHHHHHNQNHHHQQHLYSTCKQKLNMNHHLPSSSEFPPQKKISKFSLILFFLIMMMIIADCNGISTSISSSKQQQRIKTTFTLSIKNDKFAKQDFCAFLSSPFETRRQQLLQTTQTQIQQQQPFSFSLCSFIQDKDQSSKSSSPLSFPPPRRRHSKNSKRSKRRRRRRREKKEKYSKPPFPTILNEIGCSPTFNYQPFDPFHFSSSSSTTSQENFVFYREAELKHGRIAMLATIGMIVPDLMRYYYFGSNINWSTTMKSSSWLLLLPEEEEMSVTLPPPPLSPTGGIKALLLLPWQIWLAIVLMIGILEIFVLVPPPLLTSNGGGNAIMDEKEQATVFSKMKRRRRNVKMVEGEGMPGDYGLGYFGVRDKSLHERSLLSELENGRLAMIAFMIQIISEVISGQTVVEQWMSWLFELKKT